MIQTCKTPVPAASRFQRVTNRKALLEAAIASLQDRGYADATARDITARAGVSLGAIGYHYGSTQQLLDEALMEGVRRWFEPFIALLSRSEEVPAVGQLGPSLARLLETLNANRPLVVAYFEALLRAERAPELRVALAADFQALRSELAKGVERWVADGRAGGRPDPEVAASLLMAAFDGLIIQWLLDPARLPSGPQIAETIQRAANAIFDQPQVQPKAAEADVAAAAERR